MFNSPWQWFTDLIWFALWFKYPVIYYYDKICWIVYENVCKEVSDSNDCFKIKDEDN